MTADVRNTFLEMIDLAVTVLAEPALDPRWNDPSALTGYTCGALAGHLVRSLLTVDTYLDDPVDPVDPEPDALDAATYFRRALGDSDPITSSMHVAVRERSGELAGASAAALYDRASALRDRLHQRLPAQPRDASIRVISGLVMAIDEYLVTRLVELAVHIDDASRRAVATMAELARLRHGDLAMLRALTRTERATGPINAI
jgi:hypothetical protein